MKLLNWLMSTVTCKLITKSGPEPWEFCKVAKNKVETKRRKNLKKKGSRETRNTERKWRKLWGNWLKLLQNFLRNNIRRSKNGWLMSLATDPSPASKFGWHFKTLLRSTTLSSQKNSGQPYQISWVPLIPIMTWQSARESGLEPLKSWKARRRATSKWS